MVVFLVNIVFRDQPNQTSELSAWVSDILQSVFVCVHCAIIVFFLLLHLFADK